MNYLKIKIILLTYKALIISYIIRIIDYTVYKFINFRSIKDVQKNQQKKAIPNKNIIKENTKRNSDDKNGGNNNDSNLNTKNFIINNNTYINFDLNNKYINILTTFFF